jgi:hypothetical protein
MYCAINVNERTATSTNQVMVIVTHPILKQCWRANWLDTSQYAFFHEHRQCVVYRLPRDRADLRSSRFRDTIGGDMGMGRDRSQNRQTLGGDLHAVLAQKVHGVCEHEKYPSADIGQCPKFEAFSPFVTLGLDVPLRQILCWYRAELLAGQTLSSSGTTQ